MYRLNYNNVDFAFNELNEFQFCACLISKGDADVEKAINEWLNGEELVGARKGLIFRTVHPDRDQTTLRNFLEAMNVPEIIGTVLSDEEIRDASRNASQLFEEYCSNIKQPSANVNDFARVYSAHAAELANAPAEEVTLDAAADHQQAMVVQYQSMVRYDAEAARKTAEAAAQAEFAINASKEAAKLVARRAHNLNNM